MGILSVPRYMTPGDVQLRLQNTTVMYRGRPVHVGQGLTIPVNTPDDLFVDVWDLKDQEWKDRVHSSDEELEVKAQPLGYYNIQDGRGFHTAFYAARLPIRRQRQGLSQENCHAFSVDARGLGNQDQINRNHLKSRAFGEMMLDEYPSFESCLKEIKDKAKCKARAFGRKLVITEDEIGLVKLHYFTVAIGVWNPRRKEFSLPERFEHYIPVMKSHDVPCSVFE